MALNFPNSPTNGQIYTDTQSGNRWSWDAANTAWLSTSTFTQTITVSSTQPGSPVVGQLWWNQDYGRLLVYYNDGTSSQWVDASPSDATSTLAYNQANAAYTKANLSFQNTTGTLAGSLTATGSLTANGYLYVTPSGGEEGGEIQLSATGSNTAWSVDSYQNTFRVFARSGSTVSNVNFFHATGGSVRMGIGKTDPAYTLDVAGSLNTNSRGITQASMPSGSILQVVSTTKTDTFTTTTNITASGGSYTATGAAITGFSATITPTSSSSKIFVIVHLNGTGTAGVTQIYALLYRNSTLIGNPSPSSAKPGVMARQYATDNNVVPGTMSFSFLDSPSTTSSTTYSVNVGGESSSTVYVNMPANNNDSTNGARMSSTITVMEIAQ
jgi:hypothetical protein